MGGCLSSAISGFVFQPRERTHEEWASLTLQTTNVLQSLHQTPNGTFYLQCVPAKVKPLKTVVFCHGNSSDIYSKAEWYRDLCHKCKIRVIGVEYPGYGPPVLRETVLPIPLLTPKYTIVRPSEAGCNFALRDVMVELEAIGTIDLNQSPGDVYLIGHSLGTGVVSAYAAKYNFNGVMVLISPFKSITRVVADGFTGSLLGLEMFSTWNIAHQIQCRVKIFHSENDDLIPAHHASHLHRVLKFAEPIHWIEGANHAETLWCISFATWRQLFLSI